MLEKLPDDVGSVEPEGHFVKWDGKKWVHDTDAENKHLLMQTEQEKINLLAGARTARQAGGGTTATTSCMEKSNWRWQLSQ
ncbi:MULTISPECIES: tail fiber assembly protein [Citrobacter]|uniref:tail fiber assembly protein n=1 Tax=Citrobacter TaxID=544 RepID=UPI001EFBAE1E|nr:MULTISPECIES: tail fiber assembly protein [Citrobacter]MDM2854048.1 tail fiber assembly protein [Citrobacter sp. Cpo065]MDQ9158425.1 tail fiber assembly protein [Citrobacter portucalensis]MDT7469062.1 tail fiber assembly protein [Citrobacter portucalensis]MDV0560690.1 tail fiber assembly protein [Citrobacter portucalensis]MDV0585894.1 tail fiber assembly protein [Citrobacter portucalensis]